ncbi:MAG: hypothetical protein H6721_17320 [Sandaracinus sp.]|nr:hypothetical protein [Sandaracinus sp.]
MHVLLRVSLLAALLVGCASPRRVVLDPSQNTGITGTSTINGGGGTQPPNPMGGGGTVVAGGGQPVAAATGTPRERLDRVETHLRGRGFERVGPAVRNANMQAGLVVAYAIDAQPGQCFVPVALSAQGTTMNLFVIDPMGRAVANSVATASPWVRICPSTTGRFVTRLQMSQGSGEYYYALYRAPQANDPQLAQLLDGAAATPQVQTAQIDAQTQGRLQQLDNQLAGERFNRVAAPFGVVLERGGDHERPLNLQAGTCYAFASLGGPGASDTDLYILSGQGETIEQDRSTAVDAVVRFCPPASGLYTLRANMYSGQGPVFIAGYMQQAQQNAANPTNTNTGPVIGETQGGGGQGGVEQRFAILDGDVRARGYETFGERQSVSLNEGETREIAIELEADKCYAVIAVGDTTVRDLDVSLADRSNQVLDRDDRADSRAIVRVCSERAGTYKVRVQMTAGSGAFLYHAYRWPRGTRGPFGLRGLSWVRFAEVTQLLSIDGYEPDPSYAPGDGRLRRQGQGANHTLELPANYCFAVVAVGGDGVIDLGVRLSKDGNALSGDASRDAMPDVRYCTTEAGRYRVDISAEEGAGTYFYQVFHRSGGN